MTHHYITLDATAEYRARQYHVIYTSRNVYRTNRSHSPTRVEVWDNTFRLNPRNGETVRYGAYGPLDGGKGRYLDPRNIATDDTLTILITTESTVICADPGRNTGHWASGQVYAVNESGQYATLKDGDTATLSSPDGSLRTVDIHLPAGRNGHGYATFA